jgi:hypothetical protein
MLLHDARDPALARPGQNSVAATESLTVQNDMTPSEKHSSPRPGTSGESATPAGHQWDRSRQAPSNLALLARAERGSSPRR